LTSEEEAKKRCSRRDEELKQRRRRPFSVGFVPEGGRLDAGEWREGRGEADGASGAVGKRIGRGVGKGF